MTYADNPNYDRLFTYGKYNVYFLKDECLSQLHKSREVEATIQNVYSNSGATATYLQDLASNGLEMLENDPKGDKLRTNMVFILNQILYRTKHPVDSLCGIRMGAIFSFLEYQSSDGPVSEPEQIELSWLNKKVQLALEYPEAYNFFLTWGISNTPSYFSHLDTLKDRDYFSNRDMLIMSLNPFLKK